MPRLYSRLLSFTKMCWSFSLFDFFFSFFQSEKQNLSCLLGKTSRKNVTIVFRSIFYYNFLILPVMLLWVKLLIGITLAVGAQNEGHSSQPDHTEPPSDFVNHDSKCFNVKAEICTSPFPDRCNCKKIDDHSVVCCNITKTTDIALGLKCASKNSSPHFKSKAC